jgi:hypothetical protein
VLGRTYESSSPSKVSACVQVIMICYLSIHNRRLWVGDDLSLVHKVRVLLQNATKLLYQKAAHGFIQKG